MNGTEDRTPRDEGAAEGSGGTSGQGQTRDPLDELEARIDAALEEVRPKLRRAFEDVEARMSAASRDLRPRVDAAVKEVRREVGPRVDRFVADVQPRMDALLGRLQGKIDQIRSDLEERARRTAAASEPAGLIPPESGGARGDGPGGVGAAPGETPPAGPTA